MSDPRARTRAFVDAPTFQWFIIGVIVVNSLVLGLETSSTLIDALPWLTPLGWTTVAIFVRGDHAADLRHTAATSSGTRGACSTSS